MEPIGLYAGYLDGGHASIRRAGIREHLDETYLAWKGEN
jgi:hypothetical protein